jgi:hypothetical protein
VGTWSFRKSVVSYQRIYATGIPSPQKYSNLIRSVHPQSDDDSLKEDNPLSRFGDLMNDALIATGRTATSEELLKEMLEKAGYVDVQSSTFRQPIGPWAKDK